MERVKSNVLQTWDIVLAARHTSVSTEWYVDYTCTISGSTKSRLHP